MAKQLFTRRHVILGANTSDRTGATWFTGDFERLTVSIQSSTASASRYTLLGSNDDGLQQALGTPSPTVQQNGWFVLETATAPGLLSLVTIPRWVTAYRDAISVSAASNVTITLTGRT